MWNVILNCIVLLILQRSYQAQGMQDIPALIEKKGFKKRNGRLRLNQQWNHSTFPAGPKFPWYISARWHMMFWSDLWVPTWLCLWWQSKNWSFDSQSHDLFVFALQRSLDDAGNFLIPVVESFPEIAEDYLTAIPNPMDFRTIEEERLNSYQSISELQEDLILVFSNCMEYNMPDSDLYCLSQSMLELLEETFLGICNDLGVRILHHRSK